MNKLEIYNYLKKINIWHEITEHKAVYNMAELAQIDIPYPNSEAKNLFVRDDKKRNYYLITIKGNKKVNLKEFQKTAGTRPLSFASESDLMNILNLSSGAVTPLGLLNDEQTRTIMYPDRDFIKEPSLIGVHPNDNTATVWLKTHDLIRIIKEHGNIINLIEI